MCRSTSDSRTDRVNHQYALSSTCSRPPLTVKLAAAATLSCVRGAWPSGDVARALQACPSASRMASRLHSARVRRDSGEHEGTCLSHTSSQRLLIFVVVVAAAGVVFVATVQEDARLGHETRCLHMFGKDFNPSGEQIFYPQKLHCESRRGICGMREIK